MKNQTPVRTRLKNGAKKLGELWRKGLRCPEGWSGMLCQCPEPGLFCQARNLWLQLVCHDIDESRGWLDSDSPYGIIQVMRLTEFEETGLVMMQDIPDLTDVPLGGEGVGLRQLHSMRDAPEAARDVIATLKAFPGALVLGVEETAAPAGAQA